jgi:hypothetical protein
MPGHNPSDGGGTIAPRPGRIQPLGVPLGTFDPSTKLDRELIGYGLPALNAMASNPLATEFRRAFLQPRANGLPLRFMPALAMAAAGPDAAVIPLAAPTSQPAQKSVNWSGGYLSPRDGHSFVSVMADWVVPTVSVPPGRTELEFHSSTWIGLDGQKFYLDSSLPQIGTKQRCGPGLAGKPPYYAWFQWWARGQETEEVPLLLPVAPGDAISAIITVFDQDSVICNLRNVTQDVMLEAFRAWAPSPCRISGATAEWIMERPSPPESDGWETYALPVYTPFEFTRCIAESRPPRSSALHDRDLQGARLIRMYEIVASPPGTRTISTAHRVLLPEQRLELAYVAP